MKKLLLLGLAALGGCTGEIQIQGEGDVYSADGAHCYLENNHSCIETTSQGFTKRLTAAPRAGWKFDGWSYCQHSYGNVCVIDVDTETVKLGFGKDLPPMVARFVKDQSDWDRLDVEYSVTDCATDQPWDRQCKPLLGMQVNMMLHKTTQYLDGNIQWTTRRENISGTSHMYSGEWFADTFVGVGVAADGTQLRVMFTYDDDGAVLTYWTSLFYKTFNMTPTGELK